MRNVKIIGAAMLSAGVVTSASAQMVYTRVASVKAKPGPVTEIRIQNESPPGPAQAEYLQSDFGKYGFASAGQAAAHAAATAAVNPTLTAASFGISLPTAQSGWTGGAAWREAWSYMQGFGTYSTTVIAPKTATGTIDLLFFRELTTTFGFDQILAQQAADALYGTPLPDPNLPVPVNSVAALAMLDVSIYDMTSNYETRTNYHVNTYIGNWQTAYLSGDPVDSIDLYNLGTIAYEGMYQTLEKAGNWGIVKSSGKYVPFATANTNEIYDIDGNLVSMTTDSYFKNSNANKDYSFDFDWIEGHSYQINMTVGCLIEIAGIANFIDGNAGGCFAEKSAYWNGLSNIRDADGNPLAGFTLVGEDGFDLVNPSPLAPAPATAVPEPATWAMLIAGFGLVGAAQRRRRDTLATMQLA